MKRKQVAAWVLLGMISLAPGAVVAKEATASKAVQEAKEAALLEAEKERESAQAALEDARRELERAAEVRERAAVEKETERAQSREAARAYREEAEAMQRELSRVQEELRRASREVVRAHRELDPHHPSAPRVETLRLGSKAVIGVILGDSNDQGVEVLGVSPDGPSERAGLEPGDIIISVMGKDLAGSSNGDAGRVLLEAMEAVKPGDELDINVLRNGEEKAFTVTAEEREPFTWTSMIRLPSVPHVPGAPDTPDSPVVVREFIEVPQIDREALQEKMEKLQRDLERNRVIIAETKDHDIHVAPGDWEFEFEDMSEMGEEAMHSANVWFGMPLARGLKLAEVNEDLGDYFKTDHGVLVLSASEDNHLNLAAGDVIMAVAGNRVEKPADLMRELRELETGSTLELQIMRKRRSKTVEVVVPERPPEFGLAPEADDVMHFRFRTTAD